MKPFNIKLSDEHRLKLEAYRAARGLRSEADAIRDMIDNATPVKVRQAEVRERIRETQERIEAGARPLKGRFKLDPEPTKPIVSRLKGEWKAP